MFVANGDDQNLTQDATGLSCGVFTLAAKTVSNMNLHRASRWYPGAGMRVMFTSQRRPPRGKPVAIYQPEPGTARSGACPRYLLPRLQRSQVSDYGRNAGASD